MFDEKNYKIVVFVPGDHLDGVKDAMFQAGAGRIGDYDCCAWQVRGQGQFRPLEGSHPQVGEHGSVETIDEYRVEMVCVGEKLAAAVAALRLAHPFEEPAFDVIELVTVPRHGS